jgi:UDP-glucose 4-epimerase
MNTRKILVTGGAGYIGAHTTVQLIQAGYEPIVVDNLVSSDETLLHGIKDITGKGVPFFQGDCRDREFLKRVFSQAGPFHSVIHFAALKSVGESVQQPLRYFDNNLNSLLVLLEVMKDSNVFNLIFSSSCTVYGQPDVIPVTEEAPFKKAESTYGETKQMCEQIIQRVQPQGFSCISLRYFNPIGAHPSAQIGELPIGTPNNLVPFITQTAAGLRDQLTIFGGDYNTPDGTCLRDYIHIIDLADAHVKCIPFLDKNPRRFDAFNVGTGRGVSVLELVKGFIDVTGVQLPYHIGPRRAGDIEKVFADPSRAIKQLNWTPSFSMKDALLHAWQWQQKLSAK